MMKCFKSRATGVVMTGLIGLGCVFTVRSQQAAGQQAVQAQPRTAAKDDGLAELQQRNQELQMKLFRIEQEAESQNPELVEMRNGLQELHQRKLKEYGYPEEAELAKLRDMQARLQNPGKMDAAERQQLLKEFQEKVSTLQVSQKKAGEDPDVQAAAKKLSEAKSAAMNKVDENAASLQKELEDVRAQMQKVEERRRRQLQEQMQQRQGQ